MHDESLYTHGICQQHTGIHFVERWRNDSQFLRHNHVSIDQWIKQRIASGNALFYLNLDFNAPSPFITNQKLIDSLIESYKLLTTNKCRRNLSLMFTIYPSDRQIFDPNIFPVQNTAAFSTSTTKTPHARREDVIGVWKKSGVKKEQKKRKESQSGVWIISAASKSTFSRRSWSRPRSRQNSAAC